MSVLNLNNGRRKKLREDYKAETDYISILKNMNGPIFFFILLHFMGVFLCRSQCFGFWFGLVWGFFVCVCGYDAAQEKQHYFS